MKQVIPFSKDIVFKTNIASITSISLEHEESISNGEITGVFTIFGDYKIHNDTTERELFKYKLPFTALIPDNVVQNSVFVEVENFTYETIENDVLKVNIDFIIEGEEEHVGEKRVEEQEPGNLKEPENKEEESLEIVEEAVENELNYFLDNKILSNLANIEEIRAQDNDEMINSSEEEPPVIETKELATEIFKESPIFRAEVNKEETKHVEIQPEKVEPEEKSNERTEEEFSAKSLEEEPKKEREEASIMAKETEVNNEYVTYHIHIVKSEETMDAIMKNYNSNLDTLSIYNDITNIKPGDKLIIPEYLDE